MKYTAILSYKRTLSSEKTMRAMHIIALVCLIVNLALVSGKFDFDAKSVSSQLKDFTTIAREQGTDKVSVHNYGWFYDRHLKDIRFETFTLLEIGFATGNGAQSWRAFLPNARVVGFEIGCTKENAPDNAWITQSPNFKDFIKRGNLFCMSALDYPVAESVLSTFTSPLRVLIEDGGHSDKEMVLSFFYYFPRLVPGGLYFCEDLGVIYDSSTKRKRQKNFITSVVEPLQDAVQFDPVSAKNNNGGRLKVFREMVKQISCAQGICMIERSDKEAPTEALEYYKSVWSSKAWSEPLSQN